MARRAALGGFTLDLFGGGGVDAGVFNIASQSRQNEAYLALTRVEVQWEAGKVSNADYLAALATYVGTFPADSAERLNQQSRLESTTYRIERNVLVSQIEAGSKEWSDLLLYDQSKLSGLNPDSQEYLDRQNRLYNTQSQILSEEEKDLVERYGDGKMTAAQLQTWYKERLSDPRFTGNVELLEQVSERVTELGDRVIDERDSRIISDYSQGKIGPVEFLAYAATARARYADGASQALEWDNRIEQASDAAVEDDLNYRYGLSQEYLQLKAFVAGNSKPLGGVSTSTSKRTVLDANGNWKVVTQTTSKPYAPSKSEQQAYARRQIEVAEARRRMEHIEGKLGGLAGGFVNTGEMTTYYTRQLARVARGSSEWYAIQGKIDSLAEQASAEKVMGRQGIKVSFPVVRSERPETYGVPGETGPTSAAAKATATAQASNTNLTDFMRAIAKVESGGRYDARNKTSGAYGKYQIMPANWSSWAKQAGIGADAKQTPENQEKVAAWKMGKLYDRFDGDWSKMAAAWHAGVNTSISSAWGPRTRRYVSNVMGRLGVDYPAGRTGGEGTTRYGGGGGGGGGGVKPAAKGGAKGGGTAKDGAKGGLGLKAVTGVDEDVIRRSGVQVHYETQDVPFPKGMDARQFRKIYDAMESAWQNGELTATIDLGGGNRMTVFLGDDPDERNAIMGELDDARVRLADTELVAYRGTASEASKTQSAIAARKDSARHDLLVLDLAGTAKGGKVNPLAQAIRVLDNIKAGVAREVEAGNAAFKRGDWTTAYLHYQSAQRLAEPVDEDGKPTGELSQLMGLVAKANAQMQGITDATGLSIDQLLSGAGEAGTRMKNDLERLQDFDAEIAAAMAPGEKNSLALGNAVQKDVGGNVRWTRDGPGGQILLQDDQIAVVHEDGTVTLELSGGIEVREDGTSGPALPDGMVSTLVRNGSTVVTAVAKYKVGVVGYAKMSDGSKVPLKGKIITSKIDTNNDGVPDTVQSYFQNPLSGGRWSSTPIMFTAPTGASVVYAATSKDPSIQFEKGGSLFTISVDDKTGIYQVYKQTATGPVMGAQQMGDPVLLGAAEHSLEAADIFKGFARDTSYLSDADRTTSDLGVPGINMNADDWDDYRRPQARVRGGSWAPEVRRYVTADGKVGVTVVNGKKRAGGPVGKRAGGPVAEVKTPGEQALSDAQAAVWNPATGQAPPPDWRQPAPTTLTRLPTAKGGRILEKGAPERAALPGRDVGPIGGAERQTPLEPTQNKRAAPEKRKTPPKGIRRVKPLPKRKPLPAATVRAKYERIEKSGV